MTNSINSANSVIYVNSSSHSFANINNTLADEYGIYCLAEVKAYCRQTTIKTQKESGVSLIESVTVMERKSMNQRLAAAANDYKSNIAAAAANLHTKECEVMGPVSPEVASSNYKRNLAYYEKTYLDEVSRILGSHDSAVKNRYARTVALSLPLSEFERKLFVELRLAKVWDFTEVIPCIELSEIVKAYLGEDLSTDRHPLGAHYRATFRTVAELAAKGLTLPQIEAFLKEAGYMKDRYKEEGRCISTNNCTFAGGLHFGTWFAWAVQGINQSHVRDFARFMRVFSFTKFISPKLSHRQLKKLDGLDKRELKMTVTDRRNWTEPNSHDNLGFRITAIVRSVNDWQPIRKNHQVDALWLSKFGRIPANPDIKGIDTNVVAAFSRKGFGRFIKEFNSLGIDGQHNTLALAKIHTCLGAEWKSYFKADSSPDYWALDTTEDILHNVHDIGINLPASMSDEQRKFFRRNNHNFDDSVRVTKSWDVVKKHGINPLAKEGLKTAMAFVRTLKYDGVEDIEFAKECAKYGYSQCNFTVTQQQWKSRKDIAYETIPNINLSVGDWKFYRLNRDDVRGPFLGEYTGCCQHPLGAGASCAKHGTTHQEGAFVVLEYRGEIKFQSWVWRNGNCLVFDNIEGNCTEDLRAVAKAMYLSGIKSFHDKLCISRLLVGVGGSDIKLDFPITDRDVAPPIGVYTDSNRVWEVK